MFGAYLFDSEGNNLLLNETYVTMKIWQKTYDETGNALKIKLSYNIDILMQFYRFSIY